MRIVGIDPGKTGAMALLTEDETVDFAEFSDLRSLHSVMNEWKPTHAIIEKVHAMPGQGVSSTFTFGYYAGLAEGLIISLGIPYEFVRPQQWQKGLYAVSDGKEKKVRSINAAKRLFPKLQRVFKFKKDHNKAEALLIARFLLWNLPQEMRG